MKCFGGKLLFCGFRTGGSDVYFLVNSPAPLTIDAVADGYTVDTSDHR